ncbi:hypothetical protein [Nocardioides humi]|uniref:MarR family transcriptional regulator n=1 Tax=Nocardioides humi TaxID=449461 RepID=A0ABN2BP03_9ACTN|nr:hypothetical protein [Nocardioides humi]
MTGLDSVVVIRFGDGDTTSLTVTQACRHLGVSATEYEAVMNDLVAKGWLAPLDDGSFAAVVPTAEAV